MRVRTASRLHFGLLSLPAASGAHPADVATRRTWGGAGLMVEQPGIDLEARPAPRWSAAGALAERILAIVEQFRRSLPPHDAPPSCLHFELHGEPPQHQGLGTGTQLALAVGRVLAELYQLPNRSAPALASRTGRGQRSAIGIHGFDHGGFIVDGGKSQPERIAPLVSRVPFPREWRVVLLLFPGSAGRHGQAEGKAFDALRRHATPLDTSRLCRLLLLGMLPALAEMDVSAFGEALYEFNRLVGEEFRRLQGGVYLHPQAETLVSALRGLGVRGVGQSSWGPGLFAVVEDADRAAYVAKRVAQQFSLPGPDVLVTRGCNRGAAYAYGA